jgi:hypothetical protein
MIFIELNTQQSGGEKAHNFGRENLKKKPFGRARYRLNDTIEETLTETRCEGVNLIGLCWDVLKWRTFMKIAMEH